MKGGLRVFPRVVAAEHAPQTSPGPLPSGVKELDHLLGGGPDRGTATLIMGPAGSGKSTLALRYALASAERGEPAAVFAFDERVQTMSARLAGLGMDLRSHLDSKRVNLRQIDPAEMGAGQFSALVQHAVEEDGARDRHHRYPQRLHERDPGGTRAGGAAPRAAELPQQRRRVVVPGAGPARPRRATDASAIDVSYMADTVLLLRYFEAEGKVRKAMSVVKKRSGAHEDTIREYSLGLPDGIRIGPPLTGFRGVLTGVPEFVGGSSRLLDTDNDRTQR